jgi:hypothetical protein
MYSKEELKSINSKFWTDFKQYMRKNKSSNKKKINWLNYPTQIKSIYIRLETNKNTVKFSIDFQFKSNSVREIVWEQMHELKKVFENEMKSSGIWEYNMQSPTKGEYSAIYWEENYNYLNPNQQSDIFKFFEEKLICFDSFYQEYKEILLNLIH